MATYNSLRLLLLGAGGREHAFAWKLRQSKRCSQLFVAPGNAGTSAYGQNVPLNPQDFPAIEKFVLENQIDMVIVGPEEPLVRGIWDYFQERDKLKKIAVIGPSQAGAMLEGSKAWSKKFMLRHQIPTAGYQEFTSETLEAGLLYLKNHSLPIVLKADGLAAGKGVVICQSHAEADAEMREMLGGKFGAASARVVVEAFLTGIEFSVFVLTDGKTYKILPEAKDYKRIGEGDTGPNTGGMGAVSPVPFVDDLMWKKVAIANLCFTDEKMADFNSNWKVVPPLRSKADTEALLKGLADGTIDFICSNHTPWHEEAKNLEFTYADFGMIGLETFFALCRTFLSEQLAVHDLVDKMCLAPRRVLGLPVPKITQGEPAEITVFDPDAEWVLEGKDIRSKSRNTPFIGQTFKGKVIGVFSGK